MISDADIERIAIAVACRIQSGPTLPPEYCGQDTYQTNYLAALFLNEISLLRW